MRYGNSAIGQEHRSSQNQNGTQHPADDNNNNNDCLIPGWGRCTTTLEIAQATQSYRASSCVAENCPFLGRLSLSMPYLSKVRTYCK